MPQDDGRDIIIISDLHMSAGYNPRTGTYNRNEDFFYDAAFCRFIDYLLDRANTEPRRWRLVILGDLVDFLQVNLPDDQNGLTSSASTVQKLDVIARGHPDVFGALGKFLAAGNPVDIVIGNHDIEFIWPDVQQRFRALVAARSDAGLQAEITFHPWIFYVPGVVYAEHGQQYDSVNSFTTLMQPFLPHDRSLIELPLGSFFVLYLFNQLERIDPFADNIRPVTRYLAWAFRVHPIVALSTLGYHVRFFVRVLRKTSNLSAQEQTARREAYRRDFVQAAAQIGLPAETLTAIDQLAAIPALANRWRQLEALLLKPLVPTAPVLAAIVTMYQAAKRLRPGLRSLVTASAGLGGLIWRERRLLRPTTDQGPFLYRAAVNVHELLKTINGPVPAYVFGHTHTVEQQPLGDAEHAPRYYNTGTWTPIVPHAFDLLSTRERFSFVQITRDPTDGTVRPSLLVWNDAANRSEPLALLMR